jgi:F0F1-type ATP synthase membrane subunit b/b'
MDLSTDMIVPREKAAKLVERLQSEAANLAEQALDVDEKEAERLRAMAEQFRRTVSEMKGERPPTRSR